MIFSFFPSWLAGLFLSFLTAPIGSFIIWRRMSCFGDTLSHSSLLGFAISILFHINPLLVLLIFIFSLSLISTLLEHDSNLSLDVIFSIMSYIFLSLGLLIISIIPNEKKISINDYFFGNILCVSFYDLFFLFLSVCFLLIILIYNWKSILLVTIDPELAKVDGINIFKNRFILIFITGMTIAISIKFVGVLIITSLLVIPASTSQKFSRSPEKMIFISILISIFSTTMGLFISIYYDIPTSPTIVLCESLVFLLSRFIKINNRNVFLK
ncbi:MAG: iron chelate uptake ABC transporter family permease subunit [Buchnera aphidicola (Tetraneura akinire)]